MKSRKIGKNFIVYALIILFALGILAIYDRMDQAEVKEVSYSAVVNLIERERVDTITFDEMEITVETKDGDKVVSYAQSVLDVDRLHTRYLDKMSSEGKVTVNNAPPKKQSWFMSLLPTLLTIGFIVFFWMFILRMQGGGGKAMSFGKSKAQMRTGQQLLDLTFDDVAGLKEEKQELEEIVDFLKYPRKYRQLGARIPQGILLVGPPGTGKTYISKATAGEAGVPFFTVSGSDFVEMFVGVGASRVRDMFEQAKKNAPCIVFIDEIDVIGRTRGAGLGGGHDEREQTLNQLLVEMDGFEKNSGVIILGATNRPDVLDPALLRPGRFDRRIVIGIPDIKGREEIFRIHSRNKPLSEEVDPKILARRTPGFTPADIENMLNEAALITARRDGQKIRMSEVEEAITKVIAGPEKKSKVISDKEKWLTAVHESGHAVVIRSLPENDPVHHVTIVPRGMAGGFTMTLPEEDRYYKTKQQMEDSIVYLLGGRVAEMLVLEDISTGASNDIQRATDIARDMVMRYGFSSKLGPINYDSSDEVFLGRDFSEKKSYSEATAAAIDEEVKALVHEGFEKAKKIITDHMESLLNVANALMEVETIDGKQFEQLYSREVDCKEFVKQVEAEMEAERRKNREEADALKAELARQEEEERLAEEKRKEEARQAERRAQDEKRAEYYDDSSEDDHMEDFEHRRRPLLIKDETRKILGDFMYDEDDDDEPDKAGKRKRTSRKEARKDREREESEEKPAEKKEDSDPDDSKEGSDKEED